MEMRHALTIALQAFNGAILLISHDRHLLNSSVDSFYLVDRGKVDIFKGDLNDYKNYILDINSPNSNGSRIKVKKETQQFNNNAQIIKTLNITISKIEKRLLRLNEKLDKANLKLADPKIYIDDRAEDLQDFIRNQLELSNEVEAADQEWLSLVSKLETLNEDN
jgi:ATP-binding cassette subfamily F protein 3